MIFLTGSFKDLAALLFSFVLLMSLPTYFIGAYLIKHNPRLAAFLDRLRKRTVIGYYAFFVLFFVVNLLAVFGILCVCC